MKRALRRAGYIERWLHLPDVSLRYAAGPPGGVPLILLPGQSQPWQSFTRVLPALARDFEVYAVDLRGHGGSTFTPGAYGVEHVGRDLRELVQRVIGRPALVSGNSSGGLFALWLAAHHPDLVLGVIGEDPPLFSSEQPRMHGTFVEHLMVHALDTLASPLGRDVPAFFAGFDIPVQNNTIVSSAAGPALRLVATWTRLHRWLFPAASFVNLPGAPLVLKMVVRGFSEYDARFAAPFIAGQPDFDHAATLAAVRCPVLLLHAEWFEHPDHGLVGAMNDDDAARARDLLAHCDYERITSGHVVHQERPAWYVEQVRSFHRRHFGGSPDGDL